MQKVIVEKSDSPDGRNKKKYKGYIVESYPEKGYSLVMITKFGKDLYKECFWEEDIEMC